MAESFIDKDPSLETCWRSIILLGRNVASYKFALAKSLLEIQTDNSLIKLDDLAVPFAKNISKHLLNSEKQITSSSSRFLEYCKKFNKGEIDEERLRAETSKLGFVNVIDAFHNVANSEIPHRFFEDSRNTDQGITLTDNFYKLLNSNQKDNFDYEIESRWRLWETAISINISPSLLVVENDLETNELFVFDNELRRKNVTSSRDALNGYQKGKCFYCFKDIILSQGEEESCDIDHFFPHFLRSHQFENINGIWNLVIACKACNRGNEGKFERIPELQFLERLNTRNNFYIESHHPLRETIINQTGRTDIERINYLQNFYNNALEVIPIKWKPKEVYEGSF